MAESSKSKESTKSNSKKEIDEAIEKLTKSKSLSSGFKNATEKISIMNKFVQKKGKKVKELLKSIGSEIIKFDKSKNDTVISKDEVHYEQIRKIYLELFKESDKISLNLDFEKEGNFFKPDQLNGIKCSNIFYANHIGWFIQIQLVDDAIENETYLHLYLYSTDCEIAHSEIDWSVYVEANLTLISNKIDENKTITIKREYKKHTGYGEDHLINLKKLKDPFYQFVHDDNFYRIKGILNVERPTIQFVDEAEQQRILEETLEKFPISQRPSNFERF